MSRRILIGVAFMAPLGIALIVCGVGPETSQWWIVAGAYTYGTIAGQIREMLHRSGASQ